MNSPALIRQKTITGRIAYSSDAASDFGRTRGHEDFSITTYGDGTRTLRASCLIADPPIVEREIVQTVDTAMTPLDCFVRVRTGGMPTGSGWFYWGNGSAVCESMTTAEGRVSERQDCDAGPIVFCNHAIVGDAWMTAAFPFAQGQPLAAIANMFTPSRNKQGATGPTLNRLTLGLMWEGPQTIDVPAGTFQTNKFRLNSIASESDLRPENLAYEIWVLTDGSHVPALSMYRGERRYELVRYGAA